MTNVKFIKNKDGNYISLIVSGHTGYAEYGQDILCASISAISCSLALGIKNVLKIKAKIVKKDDDGFLEILLPSNLNKAQFEKSNLLFETAKVSFLDLMKGYKQYIKLEEVCDDVY